MEQLRSRCLLAAARLPVSKSLGRRDIRTRTASRDPRERTPAMPPLSKPLRWLFPYSMGARQSLPALPIVAARRQASDVSRDAQHGEPAKADDAANGRVELRQAFANLDWSFSRHSEAYRSKSFADLVRAFVVFGLCGVDALTRNNQKLMHVGRRILGKVLFQKLMSATFYGHFVAGECAETVKPMLERNLKHGVNAILYYSMEEDIRTTKNVGLHNSTIVANNKYETNVNKFLHSIDVVANATASEGDGCIAVKPSALAAPDLWIDLAKIVVRRNNLFETAFGKNRNLDLCTVDNATFCTKLPSLTSQPSQVIDQCAALFQLLDQKNRGRIHHYDFNDVLRVRESQIPSSLHGIYPCLSDDVYKETESLLDRARRIAAHAKAKGVAVMVDAEQSYFQPAISRLLAMELMRQFNTEAVVVYNTYQTYLKAARDNSSNDIAFARSEGFCLGARIVRGAYLHQEREHAFKTGCPDPVNESYEATTSTYHNVITYMLTEAANFPDRVRIMAATHNEDTIRYVLHQLKTLDVPLNCISFGQLYGMSDHLSFSLGELLSSHYEIMPIEVAAGFHSRHFYSATRAAKAIKALEKENLICQAGFRTYKSVPYGPVELVFSYLGRRALENVDVFRKTSKEKLLLQKELASRFCAKLGVRYDRLP